MDDAPRAGEVVTLAPGVRRIVAPNPSPLTYWGTNTYLVGAATVAVIDPGSAEATHLAAILQAVGSAQVSHILITHAHRDHSPLAAELRDATGAPVYAFGPPEAGRSAVMAALAAEGLAGGGEGVDTGFAPDHTLRDGDTVTGPDWALTALHTPGHFAGHLSFALGEAVFSGDHVMGWASTLISPPDGDLAAFMASCARLRARDDRVYYPGHGAPIESPGARIDWLMAHRRAREAQILNRLEAGDRTITAMVPIMYAETDKRLHTAAARSVFAHMKQMAEEGRIHTNGVPAINGEYWLD